MKNLHSQIDIFIILKIGKNYWIMGLAHLIRDDVLDVGCYTSSNLSFYLKIKCLEPDKNYLLILKNKKNK